MPGLTLLGEDTIRVDDEDPPGDRVSLAGFREVMSPEGETAAVSDRLPERPFRLVRVTVELPEEPAGTEVKAGLAEIVKSTTWTINWRGCVRDPLEAMTVTV